MPNGAFRLLPADSPDDRGDGRTAVSGTARKIDELPFRLELWTADRTAVENVLAMTRRASIGYAVFYAAAREYPDRTLTLRHADRVITEWNGPPRTRAQ